MPDGKQKNINIANIFNHETWHITAWWNRADTWLPLSAIISAAPRELRVCGCTTRKAACRLYVKGTQARSPKTSMKPKPSCTMSMVVRTASCCNTTMHKIKLKTNQDMRLNTSEVVNYKCLTFGSTVVSIIFISVAPSPHSTGHLPHTAAGNCWPVSWRVRGSLEAPPPSSACQGLWPPERKSPVF